MANAEMALSLSKEVKSEVKNENKRNEDNDKIKHFVSPPEYDKNDSRWTLKYTEPAPGLVELMGYSGVYVSADQLAECQKWSSDCKTFAVKLLTEIFTIKALSTCSWSGLDERAKNTLLQFVVEYGQVREWLRTDYYCILKGIRQVMLEMKHTKQKKTEKIEIQPADENIFQKSNFLLPPEYDDNNSRWTLKYREYAPGLVELIYDSCVYVQVIQLAKCKRLCNNSITLARMLLAEIFTICALSICSLPGADDTNTRPALDDTAITVLLNFVVEHEKKKGWKEIDKKSILRSIQQKLQVLRRVHKVDRDDKYEFSEKQRPKEFYNRSQEYNKYVSRLTLNYRERAPGLVELMENSGVYVKADKLAECKSLSNDSKTLAEKLLTEVFTRNALASSKLSKKNRECYKPYSSTINELDIIDLSSFNRQKAELDPHAEIILLNFVDEYGLEQGWPVLDFWNIRSAIISKMYGFHAKYKQKVKDSIRAAHERAYPVC